LKRPIEPFPVLPRAANGIMMKSYQLNLLATGFLLIFSNQAFFRNVTESYTPSLYNTAFLLSLGVLLAGLTLLLLTLLDTRFTIRPVLIVLLLVTSLTAYFMDSYNIVIDTVMIQNILQTGRSESMELFGPKLLLYFLLLGVLPAVFVYRVKLADRPPGKMFREKLKIVALILLVIAVQLPVFGKNYASFFREHKTLRYYSNPLTWVYSTGKYLAERGSYHPMGLISLGVDAAIADTDTGRELIIVVLGETLRADHLSLNGYPRNTNPQLSKENIISLTDMSSCGTSTGVSVPCIFSPDGHANFDSDSAGNRENLLDVLTHAGVQVLWRDNNTGSKGVANRIEYQDFTRADLNPVCDTECRDEGMLSGLQDYIVSRKNGDILIVLHQMGNHGPAYYKRYPQAFEQFTPTCKTSQLEDCSSAEINNAYDNAILYTDHFLAGVIRLLKQNDTAFETAMLYVSDHGESLGEHGVYLHGLPYIMAPREQTQVGALLWFGATFDGIDANALQTAAGHHYSHDNIFHTILGLLEINTSVYDSHLDITRLAAR
jgi:lipid A ethanolaminephosphotransferase